MSYNGNRPQVSWEEFKIFSDDEGYAIRVTKLPLHRPQYKFQEGTLNKDGKFVPFQRLVVFRDHGKVDIDTRQAELQEEAYDKLKAKMDHAVYEDAQKEEDMIMADKIVRDERRMNYGKPETKVTGKTKKQKLKKKSRNHEEEYDSRY